MRVCHVLGSDGAFGPSGTHTLMSPVVFLAIFSRIGLSFVSFSLISFNPCWLVLHI